MVEEPVKVVEVEEVTEKEEVKVADGGGGDEEPMMMEIIFRNTNEILKLMVELILILEKERVGQSAFSAKEVKPAVELKSSWKIFLAVHKGVKKAIELLKDSVAFHETVEKGDGIIPIVTCALSSAPAKDGGGCRYKEIIQGQNKIIELLREGRCTGGGGGGDEEEGGGGDFDDEDGDGGGSGGRGRSVGPFSITLAAYAVVFLGRLLLGYLYNNYITFDDIQATEVINIIQ